MNIDFTTQGLTGTQQLKCVFFCLVMFSVIRQTASVTASTWANSRVITVVVFSSKSYSASAILP